MTTYLTIGSPGVHVNNGYKTVKEDLLYGGNGYKKPFVAEKAFLVLFGSIEALERIAEPFVAHCFLHYTIMAISLGGYLGQKSL